MEVYWTVESKVTLQRIVAYIRKHFTEKEVDNFIIEVIYSISKLKEYPESFPKSTSKKYKNTRKMVIQPHTSLIYRVDKKKYHF